jgi:group I intron endonuclease
VKLRESIKEKVFCVYKITNLINGKIYIGKTYDVNIRWKSHLYACTNKKNQCKPLYKSINEYRADNFTIEELEGNFTEQEAFNREIFWIQALDSKNPEIGMNLSSGGSGASGCKYKWSEDSRKKICGAGNHNFGKPLTEECKAKLSIALSGANNPFYGRKHSEETIELLKNKQISDETKKLISEAARGSNHGHSKLTEEDVIKMRELFATGTSQKDLAEMFNVKRHTINQIVHRKRWKHI